MSILNHRAIDNGDVEVHPSDFPFGSNSESVPYPDTTPIYGGGTDKGRDGEGTHKVHRGEMADTADATKAANARGHTLWRSATGRALT